jgi:hypothetical protein
MNPDSPKLQRLQSELETEQQQQQETTRETAQTPAAREFATPEEALRYDAAQTVVPPAIARRLEDSVAQEPGPKPSWWRRWLTQQASKP